VKRERKRDLRKKKIKNKKRRGEERKDNFEKRTKMRKEVSRGRGNSVLFRSNKMDCIQRNNNYDDQKFENVMTKGYLILNINKKIR